MRVSKLQLDCKFTLNLTLSNSSQVSESVVGKVPKARWIGHSTDFGNKKEQVRNLLKLVRMFIMDLKREKKT